MPKFKKGDIVRVREGVFSTFKDRIGIIELEPIDDSFDCIVKFIVGGQTLHPKFAPEDIELVDELQNVSTTSTEAMQDRVAEILKGIISITSLK